MLGGNVEPLAAAQVAAGEQVVHTGHVRAGFLETLAAFDIQARRGLRFLFAQQPANRVFVLFTAVRAVDGQVLGFLFFDVELAVIGGTAGATVHDEAHLGTLGPLAGPFLSALAVRTVTSVSTPAASAAAEAIVTATGAITVTTASAAIAATVATGAIAATTATGATAATSTGATAATAATGASTATSTGATAAAAAAATTTTPAPSSRQGNISLDWIGPVDSCPGPFLAWIT